MDDYGFQSIRQRYKDLEKQDLHLEIQEYGNGVLEVNLINKHFVRQCHSLQKQFIFIFMIVLMPLLIKIS